MPGDKSSIISLIVTMLIAIFGFAFSVDNLFYSFSFIWGVKSRLSYLNHYPGWLFSVTTYCWKQKRWRLSKQQFASISTDKSIQVLLLDLGIRRTTGSDGQAWQQLPFRQPFLSVWDLVSILSATVSLIANSVATAFGAIEPGVGISQRNEFGCIAS